MDVLVLSDAYPYPLQNGHALRIFHYVSQLKDRHRFDLVCTANGRPPAPLQDLFRHIEALPCTPTPGQNPIGRIRNAFSVDALVDRNPRVAGRIAALLRDRPYDLIWSATDASLPAIPVARTVPVLGDLVDDGVLALMRDLPRTRSLSTFAMTLKRAILLALFERRYYRKVDGCLLVSEVDARWFRRLCPRTPTYVIHNGVDADFFAPRPDTEEPHCLVFEGNLAFGPNSDGIVHFCEAILPLIRKALPDTSLTIVGKDPTPAVQALACGHIAVTGYVDDIRPYLAQAAVFVSPLRKGAGIKNKLLQAWSMAKATVATTASVGGLAAREGENICIRNGAGEFAAAVVELLNKPARRRAMGDAARVTILQHYTWQRKAAELEALMAALVQETPSGARYA